MGWNTHDATAHAFRQDKHDAVCNSARDRIKNELIEGDECRLVDFAEYLRGGNIKDALQIAIHETVKPRTGGVSFAYRDFNAAFDAYVEWAADREVES